MIHLTQGEVFQGKTPSNKFSAFAFTCARLVFFISYYRHGDKQRDKISEQITSRVLCNPDHVHKDRN